MMDIFKQIFLLLTNTLGLKKMHSNSIGKWKLPENKARVDRLLREPGASDLLMKFNYQ